MEFFTPGAPFGSAGKCFDVPQILAVITPVGSIGEIFAFCVDSGQTPVDQLLGQELPGAVPVSIMELHKGVEPLAIIDAFPLGDHVKRRAAKLGQSKVSGILTNPDRVLIADAEVVGLLADPFAVVLVPPLLRGIDKVEPKRVPLPVVEDIETIAVVVSVIGQRTSLQNFVFVYPSCSALRSVLVRSRNEPTVVIDPPEPLCQQADPGDQNNEQKGDEAAFPFAAHVLS